MHPATTPTPHANRIRRENADDPNLPLANLDFVCPLQDSDAPGAILRSQRKMKEIISSNPSFRRSLVDIWR
jgi:hypothetical protein